MMRRKEAGHYYTWLKYNEGNKKMFCSLCKEYPTLAGHNSFVSGSTTYHLTIIRSHDSGESHIQCISWYNTDHSAIASCNKKGLLMSATVM